LKKSGVFAGIIIIPAPIIKIRDAAITQYLNIFQGENFNRRTTAPAAMFTAEIAKIALVTPISGIRTNPVIKDPTTAPAVFIAYIRPMFPPMLFSVCAYTLAARGIIIPMNRVGINMIIEEATNPFARNENQSLLLVAHSFAINRRMEPNSHRVKIAAMPISNWRIPINMGADFCLSANLIMSRVPMADPHKKVASIVGKAYIDA